MATPFGKPRRARGEDQVGEVVRQGRLQLPGLHRLVFPARIEEHRLDPRRQLGCQMAAGHQHLGFRGLQHQQHALPRVVRIERRVGASGLVDRQQRHDQLRRAVHQHAGQDLGAQPQRPQAVRQTARPLVQLAVGQADAAGRDQRDPLRGPRRLGREQLGQGDVGTRGLPGLVEAHQELLALPVRQQRQVPPAALRIAHRRPQQDPRCPSSRSIVAPSNRPVLYSAVSRSAGSAVGDEEREVELRRGEIPLEQREAHAPHARQLPAQGLHATAAPGTAATARGRAPAAAPPTRVSNGRSWRSNAASALSRTCRSSSRKVGAARQIRPEDQRVDEEADQPLGLGAVAVGDGRAHQHVLLPE